MMFDEMRIKIKPKEILQINATIIAGLLILLTIIFISGKSLGDISENKVLQIPFGPEDWLYYVGSLFSTSCIFAVFALVYEDNDDIPKYKGKYKKLMVFSIASMLAGFVLAAFGFISFA